eukprot:7460978-Karenia_brevis.AAC.1
MAGIQVDAENCFGLQEWRAIRDAVQAEVPTLAPAVVWKHADVSYVEQEGVEPQAKDRGAEQGDTYGPAETGLTLA